MENPVSSYLANGAQVVTGSNQTAELKASPLLIDKSDGVMTLTMNMPKRLNGWTRQMMDAIRDALKSAEDNDEVKVVILTGVDPYYCAGVNLAGTLQMSPPRKMHALIVEHNQALFDMYLDFPKPLLIAVNGPAIGASVTSATLCDGIIASEKANFSTPFSALGIPPEGCSSIQFARLMGEENAQRMLGPEGWKPSAQEALEAGLIQWLVPHSELVQAAKDIAAEWIQSGKARSFRGGSGRDELKAVNAEESVELASAFLSSPFIKAQFKFLWKKKKRGPAMMFFGMWLTRPLWALFL
jgi:enoyl-CoA hydratase/carnithine racemase